MRRVTASFSPALEAGVYRVASLDEVATAWSPDLRLLVKVETDTDIAAVLRLQKAGLTGLGWICGRQLDDGDVIAIRHAALQVDVLFRETDRHHAVLLTNRCNSRCLMCSQPPTTHADGWLVDEALAVIRHMRLSPAVFGFTGGEPLLLGGRLQSVLDAMAASHPATRVEVLTNGRLLADRALAEGLFGQGLSNITWLVPLYGHADFLHDFVVQAPGAFDEVIAGLLTLQSFAQPVQLRIVLIEPVLRILPELCGFIARNLPFVREVALMACEPAGYALANRAFCEVDLSGWADVLSASCRILERARVPFVLMNTPLCALPEGLWPAAARSISDWKNVYAASCDGCAVRDRCCGLFAWHERGWKPAPVRPVAVVQ